MATTALGKTSVFPAISAALFQQDRFYIRQSHFSRSPRLYFFDEHGQTLAFVRNAGFTWANEIRIFTDPTLSFELLRMKPLRGATERRDILVLDSVNGQAAGLIKRLPSGRLQCQEWSLLDSVGQELGAIKEDSLLLAGIRRFLTELIPQSYTFHLGDSLIGRAARSSTLFTPRTEVNLSGDREKQLDRRLVTAAMVLLMAPFALRLPQC